MVRKLIKKYKINEFRKDFLKNYWGIKSSNNVTKLVHRHFTKELKRR